MQKIREFTMKEVNKHEGTYDKNNIRDFVALYIQTTRDSRKEAEETFTKGCIG